MLKKIPFIFLAVVLSVSLAGLGVTCAAPGEAPTLALEVYDGPEYSESDNMCYYKVEGMATGTPEPEIEFADDDNVESIGSGRVEVGVEMGDSYTLTAIATNEDGTATASIVLEGECGTEIAEEPGPDDGANGDAEADGDGEEADGEREAPTIALEIYEGPFPVEDLCVFRVQANVSGNPSPEVTFSKDDSGGAWGARKAQVNLGDPGDTYTLTATATNSEGSATDSITLTWECDIPEEDGGDGDTVETVSNDCRIDLNLCGYIEKDNSVLTRVVWVGDNASDRQLKGYISFDISGLAGPDVYGARLVLGNITGAVDPTFADNLVVKADRYGESLDLGDFAEGGAHLKTVSTTGLTQVVITGSGLESSIQEAIDRYGDYFQIKIGLDRVSDEDGVADFFNIDLGGSSLVVETNDA